MVKERIIDWVKGSDYKSQSKSLPKNIIYYRDGVSDAQFLEVKNVELPQIERAFSDAMDELEREGLMNILIDRPTVKISALVCVKRHSVRFYPHKGKEDGHGNCKPGTQVQSVVTSPYFNNFYLQSHAAIKGTALPAHYFVLRKDQDIEMNELRTLVSTFSPPIS
jgi:eukaryotic translation initiation factor 2C